MKSEKHVCGRGNGKKQAAAVFASGGPEFNVTVCQRSNDEPVCWTQSTSGAASTAAPPSKTFYITHTGGAEKPL